MILRKYQQPVDIISSLFETDINYIYQQSYKASRQRIPVAISPSPLFQTDINEFRIYQQPHKDIGNPGFSHHLQHENISMKYVVQIYTCPKGHRMPITFSSMHEIYQNCVCHVGNDDDNDDDDDEDDLYIIGVVRPSVCPSVAKVIISAKVTGEIYI